MNAKEEGRTHEKVTEQCGFCEGGRMLRCPPNEPSFTIKCPYCEGTGRVIDPEHGPVAPYGVLARATRHDRNVEPPK